MTGSRAEPLVYGRWTVIERLGGGGNGDVWRARDPAGREGAVKVLRDTDRMERFRREIDFLMSEGDRPGILPLIDHHLPADQSEQAWYAMPVAETLRQALGDAPTVEDVVGAVLAYSATLRDLAARRIGHRDIKPENLFRLDGSWVIGDFGLVTYPEREPLTPQGHRLGPKDYLAPEMREDPDTASAELADVYSLAKTLWVLLAHERLPVPGQHQVDHDSCRLTLRLKHRWSAHLDHLIERSTAHEAEHRMRMSAFHDELRSLADPAEPEAAGPVDLEAMTRDIAIMTRAQQSQRQQREVLGAETYQYSVRLEQTLRDLVDVILPAMPGFGTRHPVQIPSPRSWLTAGTGYHPSRWWGATFEMPDVEVHATCGYILRVFDDRGTTKVYMSAVVSRRNGGRGEKVVVFEEERDSYVPSAHLDSVITEMANHIGGAAGPIVAEVRRMLEAEQGSV